MTRFKAWLVGLTASLAAEGAVAPAQQAAPHWAYGYVTPPAAGETAPPCPVTALPLDCAYPTSPIPEDGNRRALPGALKPFTKAEAWNDYGPADWFPGDHPPMPDIVASGRRKDKLRACSLCHFPNGQGKMENGGVAGLPASYILEQLADFKSGARRSADPRKANTNEMIRIAALLTPSEAEAAADYYASMQWRPWVKVIESDTNPRFRASVNGLFLPIEDGGGEPLGQRIIEVPENPDYTDWFRNPRSGFVAYVPVGSIARGKRLVTTGGPGGEDATCSFCHGFDLKGVATVPGIVGRSPSYVVRQLFDFQQGARDDAERAARGGPGARMMKVITAKMTVEDMVAIAAYLSSQAP